MFLDANGDVRPAASIDGPLAAGISGQPAALAHIAERYGALPLRASLAPAIRLANNGFAVDGHYRRMAGFRLTALRAAANANCIFLDRGQIPALGHKVKSPELASTLTLFAEQGREGFYRGSVAERLMSGVREAGGNWRLEHPRHARWIAYHHHGAARHPRPGRRAATCELGDAAAISSSVSSRCYPV